MKLSLLHRQQATLWFMLPDTCILLEKNTSTPFSFPLLQPTPALKPFWKLEEIFLCNCYSPRVCGI